MTGKKKILLIVIILLLGVVFIGIGFVLTQSTTSTTKTSAKTEEGTEQEKKTGMVGDKVAAEKLIDQTVTRDEIEERLENGIILNWTVLDVSAVFMQENFSMITF